MVESGVPALPEAVEAQVLEVCAESLTGDYAALWAGTAKPLQRLSLRLQRLRRLRSMGAPDLIVRNEMRLVRNAVPDAVAFCEDVYGALEPDDG